MNNTTDLIQKINPLFENTDLKDIFNEQAIAVMKTILILFITKIHKAIKDISIPDLLIDFNNTLKQHGGVTPPNKKKKPISILHTFKVIVLTLTLFSFLFIIYSYFVKLEERLYTEYNPPYTEYKPPYTEYKPPYSNAQNPYSVPQYPYSDPQYPYSDTESKTESKTEKSNTEKTENRSLQNVPKFPLIENISINQQEIAYIVSQAKNLYEQNNNLNIQKPFDETFLKMIEGISENIYKNIVNFEDSTKSIIENAVTNISNISFAIVIRKLFSIEGKQLIISKVLTEKTNNIIQKYLIIANIQLEDIKNDFRMELENFKNLIERLNDPSLSDRYINFLQIGLSYLTNPASSFKNQFSFQFDNIVNKLNKINNIKTTMGLGLKEIKSDAKLELDRSMNELFNHINNIYYLFGTTFTILCALIYELTPSNEGQNVFIKFEMNGNEYNGEERKYEDENKNDNQKRILYKPTGADVKDEPIVPVHVPVPVPDTRRSVTRSKTPKQITYNPNKGGKSKKSRKNKKNHKTNKKRIVKKNKTYKK